MNASSYKFRRYKKYIRKILLLLFSLISITAVYFRIQLSSHPRLAINTYEPDQVIVNLKFKKCLKCFGCLPEREKNWFLIKQPLNSYHDDSWTILNPNSFLFNYYIIVQKKDIKISSKGLTDISISSSINELPKKLIKDINESNMNNLKANIDLIVNENGWVEKKLGFLNTNSQQNQFWCKFSKINTNDHKSFVRDIDVLFGFKDLTDARPNHKFIEESLLIEYNDFPIHLSLRLKDETNKPKDPHLTIKSNRFKILQLTDVHFGLSKDFEDDLRSLTFIKSLIEIERPNLIIISGDYMNIASKSRKTSLKELDSLLYKSFSPIISSQIPFAFTFGESDYETDDERFTKQRLLEKISKFPNSVTFDSTLLDSDEKIHGVTNYQLKINHEKRYTEQKMDISKPDIIIYMLDSENHRIDDSQMSYIKQQESKLSFEESSDDISTQKQQQKPYRLAFFHHPLPNYRPKGPFQIIGSYNEKHQLETSTSAEVRDQLAELGIQAVSVGHEHMNDACLLSEKKHKLENGEEEIMNEIWLCYGGVSGFGGYGDANRIARIFEIDFSEKWLISWKVSEEDGKPFDHQMIFRNS